MASSTAGPSAGTGEPLASRMRPRTLSEFIGQEHLLGPRSALRLAIERDALPSLILWGPPGCGKTTLALVISEITHSQFVSLTAVSAGVADLRRAAEAAQKLRSFNDQRTILFIDEIHRFNKAQQDAVLPWVEKGIITLIGATTENPGFEVNGALLSRCRVFHLNALSDSDVRSLVLAALSDPVRGLGEQSIRIGDEALEHLVRLSGGDARSALSALEMAASASASDGDVHEISVEVVEDVYQQPVLLYDKAGQMHYDLISAFIKSVRGSDPQAAVYWLARMLRGGEDPLFIARRLILLASEDIGLADPHALTISVSCMQAVHNIGMPEAYLPLSECAIYLARAPKSNSAYLAYGAAARDAEATQTVMVPLHLRNAPTSVDRHEGAGKDYLYPHSYPGHVVEQDYLPPQLGERLYYSPSGQGDDVART